MTQEREPALHALTVLLYWILVLKRCYVMACREKEREGERGGRREGEREREREKDGRS
jgi:hypothetical protein